MFIAEVLVDIEGILKKVAREDRLHQEKERALNALGYLGYTVESAERLQQAQTERFLTEQQEPNDFPVTVGGERGVPFSSLDSETQRALMKSSGQHDPTEDRAEQQEQGS